MQSDEQPPPGIEESPKKGSNRTTIAVVVLFLVLLCCFVAASATVVIDPLDWDLLSFISGESDDIVEAMPVRTDLYAGLDMDQLTIREIGRLVDPFLVESEDFDYREFAEFLREIDDELESEAGFNLSDDILPWIGPKVGIGIVDYRFSEYGSLEELEFLVIAESRDNQAADNFIEKLLFSVEDNTGFLFRELEKDGVTIYELDTEFEDERIAIARSGNLVYLGSGADVIEDSIGADRGRSLAENEEFSTLQREMAADRAVTLYVSADFIDDSTGGLASEFPVDPDDIPLIGKSGGALTISIIEAGLRVDLLTLVAQLSEEERILLQGSAAQTAELFPESTVVYVTSASINQLWEALTEVTPDFEEAMEELSDELGFDIVDDFIVVLDGETGRSRG